METVYSISDLQSLLCKSRNEGYSIGFVPTMGALHEGHLSLVEQSKMHNDVTVVSIFVNPTQFNNVTDLEKYPRTIDEDCKLLDDSSVDIVFIPSVEEIYPVPDNRVFDFGLLGEVMEGKFRPGHFNGVAQVVSKLFDMVKPDRAYFGEKDFQQLAIVRDMVRRYDMPVDIVAVPIMRESSGLAMSSRNRRLSDSELVAASNIYRILLESKNFYSQKSIVETINYVVGEVNRIEYLNVEYFEIVDGNTLQAIDSWSESDYVVGCITVFCGEVRLIDNIVYTN